MMSNLNIYFFNLMLVSTMMFLGWLVSLTKQNVNIVDSLWGFGFVLIAWSTFILGSGYPDRKLLVVVLTTLWGLRLSIYLTWRNWRKPEDKRYGSWRAASGAGFWIVSLFKVFLLQALFMVFIAATVQWPQMIGSPGHLTGWDVAGALICLAGFLFETVADLQLARFKSKPRNKGKVMQNGLWAYSRHPNYFGECLVWWGFFVICLANPAGIWTLFSPLIVTLVLVKLTGVALTEKTMLKSRPQYLDYMQRTPSFIPWFPKKEV
jgi:steroid 5-alpha reductase family enzyme